MNITLKNCTQRYGVESVIEMSRHSLWTDSLPVTVIIGFLALVSSMTAAFLVGIILAYLLPAIRK